MSKMASMLARFVAAVAIISACVLPVYWYAYQTDPTQATAARDESTTMFKTCAHGAAGLDTDGDELLCFRRELRAWVQQFGLDETATHFDAYVQSDQGAWMRGGACHSLGHDLGEAALLHGYSGTEILNSCSSACEEGCFNGVGHAYAALHQDGTGIDAFCKPKDFSGSRARTDACYHGFGHGLGDVFGFDLVKNIKRCNNILDDEGRFQCGHAVFMALSTMPSQAVREAKLPQDMVAFCTALNEIYRSSCFVFAGYLEYGTSGEAAGAFATCKRVPSELRKECSARIGESIFLSDKDPDRIIQSCGSAPDPSDRKVCFGTAAKVAVTDSTSRVETGGAICAAADGADQRHCFGEFGAQVQETRGAGERARVCALFPDYASYCLDNY